MNTIRTTAPTSAILAVDLGRYKRLAVTGHRKREPSRRCKKVGAASRIERTTLRVALRAVRSGVSFRCVFIQTEGCIKRFGPDSLALGKARLAKRDEHKR